jgi:hypothetical protein
MWLGVGFTSKFISQPDVYGEVVREKEPGSVTLLNCLYGAIIPSDLIDAKLGG